MLRTRPGAGWLARGDEMTKATVYLCRLHTYFLLIRECEKWAGKDGRAGAAGRSDLASRQALHVLVSTPPALPDHDKGPAT